MKMLFSANNKNQMLTTPLPLETKNNQTTNSSFEYNIRVLRMSMFDRIKNSKKCESCGGK
jgi:hypothetical protein